MTIAFSLGLVGLDGAALVVEPCIAALAAGDGRELWSFRPGGQMVSVIGKKCASVSGGNGTDAARVILGDCATGGEGSAWEAQGNGQLRHGKSGANCLSQRGSSSHEVDVALGAAATASSTLEALTHGATMVADGNDATFWASQLGIENPVTLTLDIGSPAHLQAVEIAWEYPAKQFSIALSQDSVRWAEVFSTDSNMVHTTKVRLGSRPSNQVRVSMRRPHPLLGQAHGRALYGIRSVVLTSLGAVSVIDDCADAARSADARDKYISIHVKSVDLNSAGLLRSEMPSLAAAESSLASVVGELSVLGAKVADCEHAFAAASLNQTFHTREALQAMAASDGNRAFADYGQSIPSEMGIFADAQHGLDPHALVNALGESRHAILAVRASLL